MWRLALLWCLWVGSADAEEPLWSEGGRASAAAPSSNLQQFVKLAGVYKFDYRIAYLIPPAVMLAVSATLFRRRSG